MQKAFAEPGGTALKRWIDNCPNQRYAALCFQGGAAFRKHLLDDIGDQSEVTQLIDRRSDEELLALMSNLGGHDMSSMIEAFEAIDHDRPVCFIAYTIKGVGLPFQGHKDNHAGLMTADADGEVARLAEHSVPATNGTSSRPGQAAGGARSVSERRSVQSGRSSPSDRARDRSAAAIDLQAGGADVHSTRLRAGAERTCARRHRAGLAHRHRIARRHRVDQSRRLGQSPRACLRNWRMPTCSGRRKFPRPSTGITRRRASTSNSGIAEMNLFILLSALGLSHSINGARLLPVGTLYDPFIQRGLDALNYACYQDARFMVAATPSGITLAPEGGAHQSIATPLIGIAQDGLASFEPAFVDELAVIMGWGFAHMQREGGEGGSVYLRLSTRTLDQPQRIMTPDLQRDITEGAYWLREPRTKLRSGHCLHRRGGAGSDRGGWLHRRKPSRRRPARDHLGRPAAWRLDRRAEIAPRPPRRAVSRPHRKTAGAVG